MSNDLDWEKWYWRKWKADRCVRRLNGASRAIWFEVLGDMWESDSASWTGAKEDLAAVANVSLEEVDDFLAAAVRGQLCYVLWPGDEPVDNCCGQPVDEDTSRHLCALVPKSPESVTLVSRRKLRGENRREYERLRKRQQRSRGTRPATVPDKTKNKTKNSPKPPQAEGAPESAKKPPGNGSGKPSWNTLWAMPDGLLCEMAKRYGVATHGKEKGDLVKAVLEAAKEAGDG